MASCGSAVSQKNGETPELKKSGSTLSGDKASVALRTRRLEPSNDPDEKIIYLREGSVWVMDADGENAEQLTLRALKSGDESPSISPDGKLLSFASAKDGSSKIYVQSMEDMIPMAASEGEDHDPAWSPDGTKIVFTRGDIRLRRDLYWLDLASEAGPEMLLEGEDLHPEKAGGPVFSPDGKRIVFAADRSEGKGTALWQLHLQSRELTRLTPMVEDAKWVVDRSPSFSPDGSHIVFVSNRHASSRDHADDFDIYSIAADGSGLTRLSEDPGVVADPVYSSDGSRIYFASTRIRKADFEWEIFVMPAGGGEQRRLTRDRQPQNSAPFSTSLPKVTQ